MATPTQVGCATLNEYDIIFYELSNTIFHTFLLLRLPAAFFFTHFSSGLIPSFLLPFLFIALECWCLLLVFVCAPCGCAVIVIIYIIFDKCFWEICILLVVYRQLAVLCAEFPFA